MTDHVALSLLDDYLDGDLDPTIASEIQRHLDNCDQCRAEYDTASGLKELLKGKSIRQPDTDYWNECSRLILARTIEAEPDHEVDEPAQVHIKRDFARSLLSLAASIVVLFSAIYFGQNQQTGPTIVTVEGQEIILTSSLHEALSDDLVQTARTDLTRGYMLMGPPGIHNRAATLTTIPKNLDLGPH